jgi:membrane protein required for beta-lactamase induction
MDPVAPLREVPLAAPLPPNAAHRSRWRGSAVTFGPFGRIVATVALVAPLWWWWETGLFGWPGLMIWAVVFMPWGRRDVWSPSRVRSQ